MSNIAINLKLLRDEARLTTSELAEKTGINERLIIAFENDELVPNDYQLEVLCKVLKMPSDEIASRNLPEERKNATKEMKHTQNRNNYNWYFGNRKHLIFYLCYIAYFLVGVTTLVLYYTYKFDAMGITSQKLHDAFYLQNLSYPYFVYVILIFWQNMRFGLIAFSFGISFFILFEYFSSHRFVFRWWYIFWITIFVTFIELLGLFGAIPYLIIILIRIIKRKY